MLGIGAMISELSGNEDSVKAFKDALNKEIKDLSITDNALKLKFEDGTTVEFYDDGQSCCESRYMNTDDELKDYVGAKLLDASVRDGGAKDENYGVTESQFLIIETSKGSFTVANYNEHNGYYGGISLRVRSV